MFSIKLSAVSVLPLLALMVGCGGPLTYAVRGSTQAPEADAKIVADVHKDGDFTTLKVDVQNLAPPDRLGGGSTFVVWTKDDKPKWHRVGALKYDTGSRKGSLEGASVPVTEFELKVTSESKEDPEIPSDFVVIAQHVN